jgi:hypothetical protein
MGNIQRYKTACLKKKYCGYPPERGYYFKQIVAKFA